MSKRKPESTMTAEQVKERVRAQATDHLSRENDHSLTLSQALVEPDRITVIVRTVRDGNISDKVESVWLVAKGPRPDGYRVVMQADGRRFGLASSGFPNDPYPVLVGWYGDLVNTFMAM